MQGDLQEVLNNVAHYTLLSGHVIDKLKEIPEKSVQLVVSSPPYHGLRKYQTEPQIWGDLNTCHHEWSEAKRRQKGGVGENKGLDNSDEFREERDTKSQIIDQGCTCTKCGVWKGEFGSNIVTDCLAWARKEASCGQCYVCCTRLIFTEIKRVLRDDGCVFWNLGDTYASDKNLEGVPWRVALAVQSDGWILRRDLIWGKSVSFCDSYTGSCMPESVVDRPTSSFEYIFMFTKQKDYYYDNMAVREKFTDTSLSRPSQNVSAQDGSHRGNGGQTVMKAFRDEDSGRNLRSVWIVQPAKYKEAHFATYPIELIDPIIKLVTSEKGCCSKCGVPWERITESNRDSGPKPQKINKSEQPDHIRHGKGNSTLQTTTTTTTIGWESSCECNEDVIPCLVLDPFNGSGTSGIASLNNGRRYIGIDLNESYIQLAHKRIQDEAILATSKPTEEYF